MPITRKPRAQTPATRNLDLDVKGKDGADAKDGVDGSNGSYSGSDGRDGSDAGRARRGEDGGDIRIDLHASDAFDGVQVRGSVIDADGGQSTVDTPVGQGGRIDLDARGGDGGAGGDGGDGGDGRRGSDGSNATRYSRGQDGEDGGDGGDGGRGSHGEDAGRGGRVDVNVDAKDSDYLAMIDSVQVGGGDGGRAGRHGDGGSGGAGGDGGSSYSWTETTGSGDNERTEHHSNSGGWDGSRGSSGSSPSGHLSSGADGKDGRFQIHVRGEDGQVQSYDDRYRLHTSGVTAVSDNADGIIEPGEGVTVDARVDNRGPMASPTSGNTVFSLRANEMVRTSGKSEAKLSPGIASGQGEDVNGLRFTAADSNKPAQGERLSKTGTIDPEVQLTRAGRTLPEAARPTSFEVTYPVEITPIEGDRTATLQDPASVSWSVRNVSSKPLGEGADCKRMVESFLERVGGDAPVETLTFTNAKGETLPLIDGVAKELEQLGPGESVNIRGKIGFSQEAPAYSNVQLRVSLGLDDVNDVDTLKTIQQRVFSVQLARTYAQDPDAGLLVVVNNRTSKEEIAAWEKLAEDMGTKANLWNVSLYGAVSLTDAVASQELGEHFAGKTCVVLNNDYDVDRSGARPRRASKDLAAGDTLKATVASNLATYFVGGQMNVAARLDTQSAGPSQSAEHGRVKNFLNAAGDGAVASEQGLGRDVIEVHTRGKATKEDLDRAGAKVLAELEDEHPERRYDARVTFTPEKDDSFWSFLKKHKVGTLEITRSVDVNRHSVAHMFPNDIHDPSFVLSDQNRYAVTKSMPFSEKLAALERLDGVDGAKMRDITYRAVLSDVAEEQQVLRQEQWDFGFSEKDARGKLRRLGEITAGAKPAPLDSPRGQLVVDLVANVEHMTGQATSIWDRVLPGRVDDTVSDASRDVLDDLMKKTFSPEDLKKAKALVAEKRGALQAADDAQLEGASTDEERAKLELADEKMAEYLRPQGLDRGALRTGYTAWAAGD
jgi:hypothetical protein